METTRRIDAFLAAPQDRCFLGGSFAYWSADAELWGLTVWGHVTRADVERLRELVAAEFRLDFPPYASIVDMRRLTSIDDDGFVAWARFLDEQRAEHRAHVLREAVVRPTAGLVASVMAGYVEVLAPPYPAVVTGSLEEALSWLGRTDAIDTVEDIHALATGNPLDALRTVLVPPFVHHTLDAAAQQLGVSRRTLQRQLARAGTTFQGELAAARIRAAQSLLLRSDHKLSAIAREVGFATQAHFTTVFRRVTGERPAQWRARHRATDPTEGQ